MASIRADDRSVPELDDMSEGQKEQSPFLPERRKRTVDVCRKGPLAAALSVPGLVGERR
jgi:hypothetical protein